MSEPYFHRRRVVQDNLLNHLHFQAARRAVLYAFDRVTMAKAGFHGIPNIYNKLGDAWADLVVRLVQAGWKAAETASVGFIANCPAFGVNNQLWRGCGYARICPFCWGRRYVIRNCCRINDRLPVEKEVREAHQLIEFHNDWENDFSKLGHTGAPVEEPGLSALLQEMRQVMEEDGRREIDVIHHSGAFVCNGFHLSQKDKDHGIFVIIYRRRGVLLVPRGMPFTKMKGAKYSIHDVTDKNLIEIVGRVCHYPAGWLIHGSESQILRYLDAFTCYPMFHSYGGWRDKKPKSAIGEL